LRVTVLVALVAVLLSCATALATRTLLVGQVDRQLDSAMGRFGHGPGSGGGGGPGGGLLLSGQQIGTLFVAVSDSGTVLGSGLLGERGQRPELAGDAAAALRSVPDDNAPHTVAVPGVGRYRVAVNDVAIQMTDGSEIEGRLVVGVPLAEVDRTMVQLIGLEAVLSIIAIAVTIFASRALVERSLRPLNRVAATAQQVSKLELDRGEVALAVRVPPEDTDPASEVGRVGLAINHMLNNVAGALEARQASESKVRQFVADASHELRNPLAAIRGYAELTRRSGEDLPPDAAYAIGRVEAEAERMSRLVEDLLLLARLDSGPAIEIAPTDLTEIALNAVSDARAAGPDHAWALSLPDEPIEALGDRHRLHQVVANLLANARTHTPAGTRIETGLSVVDGEALLTVTDDGPGIPAGVRDTVFERFTRADTSRVRAAGGEQGTSTGLGLAIVAAVVEAHQGRVSVQSEPGRTRFAVTLPLAPTAAPSR
jgi:two-component system OmpR family sensor kinase